MTYPRGVVNDVKNAIYRKLLTLSMDFYSNNATGKLMSRITYDAAVIRDSISTGLTDLIYSPVQLVIYISILFAIKVYFSISWALIGISACLFLMVVYPVVRIGKRLVPSPVAIPGKDGRTYHDPARDHIGYSCRQGLFHGRLRGKEVQRSELQFLPSCHEIHKAHVCGKSHNRICGDVLCGYNTLDRG